MLKNWGWKMYIYWLQQENDPKHTALNRERWLLYKFKNPES